MQSKEGTAAQGIKAVAVSGLIGGVIAFVIYFLALLAASVLVFHELVPEAAMVPLCIASCALGSFLGAAFAFRHTALFPAMSALGAGVFLCLLLLLAALLFEGRPELGISNLAAFAAALAAGGLVGLAGRPRKKSKKRK